MTLRSTSNPSMPRFDAFLTAAENRRDDWQRLQSLAQAWCAADGDDGAAAKLSGEAQELLSRLETLGGLWAFPGPVLMQKLRDKLTAKDATGCAGLARRLAKAVLGGTYRRDENAWSENGEE